METATIFFGFVCLIGLGLVLWGKYTESGRRFIEGDY